MALITSSKLFLEFDDATLTEEVDSSQFLQQGDSFLLADGGGWNMNRSAYLYLSPAVLSLSSAFSIGFWLRPSFPGLAASGSSTLPMRISLIDYGVGVVDSSGVSISAPLLRLVEEATANASHRLAIVFGDVAYKAVSETYSTEMWHHFWIVYDGSSLLVFIDGVASTVTVVSGSLPASISGETGIFSLNRLAFSPAADILNNTGDLDDVCVMNAAEAKATSVQRIINQGFRSYADTTKSAIVELDWTSTVDDPVAVRTNGVYDNGSTVLSVRSDGKMMQGMPLFWTSRRRFADPAEGDAIETSENIVLENGFLKISEGKITL